jgi:hypothetical protein
MSILSSTEVDWGDVVFRIGVSVIRIKSGNLLLIISLISPMRGVNAEELRCPWARKLMRRPELADG